MIYRSKKSIRRSIVISSLLPLIILVQTPDLDIKLNNPLAVVSIGAILIISLELRGLYKPIIVQESNALFWNSFFRKSRIESIRTEKILGMEAFVIEIKNGNYHRWLFQHSISKEDVDKLKTWANN